MLWTSSKRNLLAGAPKTVEFDFDLAADTAYSVANEMVSDLSLSHDDAKVIVVKLCCVNLACSMHDIAAACQKCSHLHMRICRLAELWAALCR